MTGYRTVEEKAREWGLTTRTIQALCREGKIEGAAKRAGSWFIPETTQYRSKAAHENGRYLIFSGTKRRIFETAIALFGQHSYELVTVKDIAEAVGIRQSAVYNHFPSKQDILDTIYAFYKHYFLSNRPTIASLEPILRTGSPKEIIQSVVYSFAPDVETLMLSITKIVFQRQFNDDAAKEICRDLIIGEGMSFCEKVFETAVQWGCVAPFNTHLLAYFCSSVRMFLLWNIIVNPDPEHLEDLLNEQTELIEWAARHLDSLPLSDDYVQKEGVT